MDNVLDEIEFDRDDEPRVLILSTIIVQMLLILDGGRLYLLFSCPSMMTFMRLAWWKWNSLFYWKNLLKYGKLGLVGASHLW